MQNELKNLPFEKIIKSPSTTCDASPKWDKDHYILATLWWLLTIG